MMHRVISVHKPSPPSLGVAVGLKSVSPAPSHTYIQEASRIRLQHLFYLLMATSGINICSWFVRVCCWMLITFVNPVQSWSEENVEATEASLGCTCAAPSAKHNLRL